MNCLIILRRAPDFFLRYVVSLKRRQHTYETPWKICTSGKLHSTNGTSAEQCVEKLTALLKGEEKDLLLRLLNADNEIDSTLALENFILGFRLGMRVAIEALDEDDGSLTALPEGW